MARVEPTPRPQGSLPVGLYEQVLTDRLAALLPELDSASLHAELTALDPAENPRMLARHTARAVERILAGIGGDDAARRQVELVNDILSLLGQRDVAVEAVAADARALYAVAPNDPLTGPVIPPRPLIPLSSVDLLVNGEREPRVGHQIAAELESADSVDLLCAFVRWAGVRVLRPALERAQARGLTFRVLTTTYMGVTETRALEELVRLGAEVRVCYERNSTRLHAKAWLFERRTGFSTGYVGSSNLSHSALMDGMEWNVRVSEVETPTILTKFRATFDEYWQSNLFEPYDLERFHREVGAQKSSDVAFAMLDVRPTHWQEQVLYQLEVERERHGRWRNLVIAATGTGKTVLAALDYRRLRARFGDDTSLLFVAHRREILQQSQATFRAVLKDPSFGEMYVGGERPVQWRHVFASIQSLTSLDPTSLPPEQFRVVVVDEFHHAAADTYRTLLDHVQPDVLVGLTATPERADGQDITARFDGRFAAELRVWTAIEEGWLCPFQYFGVADPVDLSTLRWQRGGYVLEDLDRVFTGNDARLRVVLNALKDVVTDVASMRALGFCVSVAHAEYMARQFARVGIAAEAASASTPLAERDAILRRLRSGETKVVFSVDLFNEGVDIPEVDTILLLRPTESATVFLQQLGRGLRWADNKAVCTVVDLIGQQRREFRWDLRLRALTGSTRAAVMRDVEQGFPFLPPGCHISLDRVSAERVLSQVRQSLQINVRTLEAELRSLGDVTLQRFLRETVLEPEDLYRSNRSWMQLRRRAGMPAPPAGEREEALGRAIGRLLHVDDPERLAALRRVLADPQPMNDLPLRERRIVHGLLWDVFGADVAEQGPDDLLRVLADHPAIAAELYQLFDVLDERATHMNRVVASHPDVPLAVHGAYTAKAVLAALGASPRRIANFREGVFWHEPSGIDAFFVTLQKSERQYSPTTMYQDYAISPTLFHWESQSTTSVESRTGRRYLSGGSSVWLFARGSKQDSRNMAAPYLFLGPVRYVSHDGDRPIGITWQLEHPMPPEFFSAARVAAG